MNFLPVTSDMQTLESASVSKKFTELPKPRAYQYSQGMYNKYLLMTNTVNVLP